MTPALEYLIRTDLVKEWLTIPCSLFLYEEESFRKKVVTVSEEFKPSGFYSVKHWNVADCSPEQALPHMDEFRVPKERLFSDQAVVLPDHRLMTYRYTPVPHHYNSYKKPMTRELYAHFYDSLLDSLAHFTHRQNWLWNQFVRIYAPDLCSYGNYIPPVFRSDAEVAEDQRELTSRFLKRQWQYWTAWKNYLFHAPGELVFYKEYHLRA